MTTQHMTILNAEIAKQLNSNCIGCNPKAGKDQALCRRHQEQMVQEILADRVKRAALPVSVAKATCCYGCKTNSSLGCYRKLNSTDGQWIQAI